MGDLPDSSLLMLGSPVLALIPDTQTSAHGL